MNKYDDDGIYSTTGALGFLGEWQIIADGEECETFTSVDARGPSTRAGARTPICGTTTSSSHLH
eukprot:SAG11_NODE_32146_length_286_cov_0.534759_1_plen_63_part_01